jgi:hypothetical protein
MLLTASSLLVALAFTAGSPVEGTEQNAAAAAAITVEAPGDSETIAAQGFPLRSAHLTPQATEAWMVDTPETRPAALPALYATLGALQAFDVYSTRRALAAGAGEANPLMRRPAGNSGAMLAVKALSTAGTIYFTERAWKKNRKGALILIAAINGVNAAIVARNLSHAR